MFLGKGNSMLSEKILILQHYFLILQKECTYLKSKELEELPLFRVMSWKPS